ncbi:MAG: hypothetical protein AAGD11_06505 [Planctomycetota bacterium]
MEDNFNRAPSEPGPFQFSLKLLLLLPVVVAIGVFALMNGLFEVVPLVGAIIVILRGEDRLKAKQSVLVTSLALYLPLLPYVAEANTEELHGMALMPAVLPMILVDSLAGFQFRGAAVIPVVLMSIYIIGCYVLTSICLYRSSTLCALAAIIMAIVSGVGFSLLMAIARA